MPDLAELNIKVKTDETKTAAKDLDNLGKSGTGTQIVMDGLSATAQRLASASAALAASFETVQRACDMASGKIYGTSKAMDDLNKASSRLLEAKKNTDAFSKGASEVSTSFSKATASVKTDVDSLNSNIGSISNSLSSLKMMAGALGLSIGFHEAYEAVKKALNIVDEYKRATVGIAATLTDTSKTSGDELKLVYQDNLTYAQETYNKVQLAAAKYSASGKEMVEGWQILTNKGIRLTSDQDINNLGIVVDKIKLVTQGQESSIQIAQEIRSALSGQARAGDQLAMLLEDRIGPKWKEILQDHLRDGDALAFIASQVKGVGVASDDLANMLSSQLNTTKTLISQIVQSGFKGMYNDSVTSVRSMNDVLRQNLTLIANGMEEAYKYIKIINSFQTSFFRDRWRQPMVLNGQPNRRCL